VNAEPSPDRQRLLPVPVRRPAAVVTACCLLVFLVLAVRFHGAVTYGGFDGWVDHTVPPRRTLPTDALAPLTDIVPTVLLGLAAAATLALLVTRRWRSAALAVLGPGLTLLLVEVGKLAVGRLHQGVLSLPSGHTAVVTSVAVVGAVLLLGRRRQHVLLAATLGALAVTVAAAAMAFLLVALRWHYATDTVAGYCVAIAATLGVAFLLDALVARRIPSAAHGAPTPWTADRPRSLTRRSSPDPG
jgi:undecaprenyl-diphosphatase